MRLFKSPTRPDAEGWAAVQRGTKDLPREVVWPDDRCSRCLVYGPMDLTTGKPLCAVCSEHTTVQVASPLGLHERRAVPQVENESAERGSRRRRSG